MENLYDIAIVGGDPGGIASAVEAFISQGLFPVFSFDLFLYLAYTET